MANYNIYAGLFTFTVTTPSVAPVAGDKYTNNGATFTVISCSGTTLKGTLDSTGGPSASGTLTRSTGTGDATIAFSAFSQPTPTEINISDTYWAAQNDSLTLLNSVVKSLTLNIDAQYNGGADAVAIAAKPLQYINPTANICTLTIKNTSTTTPLIVPFSFTASNTRSSSIVTLAGPNTKFNVQGAWIELGFNGSGADGQSYSLDTLVGIDGALKIDWPVFVQVQSVAGSWASPVTLINIGGNYTRLEGGAYASYASYPLQNSSFGACSGADADIGGVFEWSESTRTIYFGGSAGGYNPGLNCKVRIPNIFFTLYNGTTYATHNTNNTARGYIAHAGGKCDFTCCNFGIRCCTDSSSTTLMSYTKYRYVGVVAWHIRFSPGEVDLEGVYAGFDCAYNSYAAGLLLGSNSGRFRAKDIIAVGRTANGMTVTGNANAYELADLKGYVTSRNDSGQAGVQIGGVRGNHMSPLIVGKCTSIGGTFRFGDSANVCVSSVRHSDTLTGTLQTTVNYPLFYFDAGIYNCSIYNVRKVAGGAAVRGSLTLGIGSFNPTQFALHDIVYDGQSNLLNLGAPAGKRVWYANMQLDNPRSGIVSNDNTLLSVYPIRVAKILSNNNTINFGSSMSGVVYQNTQTSTATTVAVGNRPDASPFWMMHTNGEAISGQLHITPGAFTARSESPFTVTGGVEGVDWGFQGNSMAIPGSGLTVLMQAKQPIRGLSATSPFVNVRSGVEDITFTGTTATSGVTYSFDVWVWGDEPSGTYSTLNGANLASRFAALTGYDAAVGCGMALKIETSTQVLNRAIQSIKIGATSHWLALDNFTMPEVGFIELAYAGDSYVNAGASVAICDNTVPSAPVLKFYNPSSSADVTYEYPYNFNGVATNVKVIARRAGYREGSNTIAAWMAGGVVPLALVPAFATTDADIDAAHLAIDGAAKTYTVSATHTLVDAYQRSQWWAHQKANMLYAIPLTSNDGATFYQPADWSLTGIEYLSAGTIDGGTVTLASPGTLSVGLSNSTINLPGEGTYSAAITSSILNFSPTTGAVTYNLSGGTFTGTIDLRNTTSYAITVQLPSGTSYTIANNPPGNGSITVDVPEIVFTVTNVIPGSDVTTILSGTETVLQDDEDIAGTTSSYAHTGGDTVDVTVYKSGYYPAYLRNINLGTTNQSVPITQTLDTSYLE